jgi:dTDP-4-dehydrorhamnose 3,5-epimerase
VIFTETPLAGAYLIEPEALADERGIFARIWCARELAAHGLETTVAQCSISYNPVAGTLRGLHYQVEPHGEVKIVRCTAGSVFDAIVDLRAGSPTCGQYYAVVLSAANRCLLYIPRGFAHGFQTLEDGSEVFYQMTQFYEPGSGRGVRWNDPAFAIPWPGADRRVMSERDRTYPDFHRALLQERNGG